MLWLGYEITLLFSWIGLELRILIIKLFFRNYNNEKQKKSIKRIRHQSFANFVIGLFFVLCIAYIIYELLR